MLLQLRHIFQNNHVGKSMTSLKSLQRGGDRARIAGVLCPSHAPRKYRTEESTISNDQEVYWRGVVLGGMRTPERACDEGDTLMERDLAMNLMMWLPVWDGLMWMPE